MPNPLNDLFAQVVKVLQPLDTPITEEEERMANQINEELDGCKEGDYEGVSETFTTGQQIKPTS